MARTNNSPIFRSATTNEGVKGRTTNDIRIVTMMRAGARTNRVLSANAGTQSSFMKILLMSATTWSRPNRPTRFGPYRSCQSPRSSRYTQINRAAKVSRTVSKATMRAAVTSTSSMSSHSGDRTPLGQQRRGPLADHREAGGPLRHSRSDRDMHRCRPSIKGDLDVTTCLQVQPARIIRMQRQRNVRNALGQGRSDRAQFLAPEDVPERQNQPGPLAPLKRLRNVLEIPKLRPVRRFKQPDAEILLAQGSSHL